MSNWTRRALVATGLASVVTPVAAQEPVETAAYGSDPRQQIDLYGPFGETRPAPVLMWLPGGGWRTHERTDVWNLPAFARRNGLLLAACDYRAIPGFGARHMAQDAAAAFAWLSANAARLGADPRRIFVMGHSAGGHLAALINCDPAYLNAVGHSPADLAGVILLDGAAYDAAEQRQFLQAHGRTAGFFDVLFEGRYEAFTPADRNSSRHTFGPNADALRLVSPLCLVPEPRACACTGRGSATVSDACRFPRHTYLHRREFRSPRRHHGPRGPCVN